MATKYKNYVVYFRGSEFFGGFWHENKRFSERVTACSSREAIREAKQLAKDTPHAAIDLDSARAEVVY